MTAISLTNIHGYKHKVPLTTSAQLIAVSPGAGRTGGGRVQLIGNVDWMYSSQDEGSTPDDWVTVSAGRDGGFDTGSRSFSFYAKLPSGGPKNLHIVEL